MLQWVIEVTAFMRACFQTFSRITRNMTKTLEITSHLWSTTAFKVRMGDSGTAQVYCENT